MRTIFTAICLGTLLLPLQAQKKPLALRLSIFNESTALPFTRFFTLPIHPGIQAGTDFTLAQKKQHHLYQTIQAGYIWHRHLYQAVFVQTETAYDYRFRFGLTLKALFGIGYMHSFSVKKEYRFINGHYVQKPDRGNARAIPSLSLGIGYRVQPKTLYSPEIFLLYQSWIEYPYSPGFIPAMTHVCLQFGTRFYIQRKS